MIYKVTKLFWLNFSPAMSNPSLHHCTFLITMSIFPSCPPPCLPICLYGRHPPTFFFFGQWCAILLLKWYHVYILYSFLFQNDYFLLCPNCTLLIFVASFMLWIDILAIFSVLCHDAWDFDRFSLFKLSNTQSLVLACFHVLLESSYLEITNGSHDIWR